MADEQLDKNEEATPHKLMEARKRGQVAKSIEFTSSVGLICTSAAILIGLPAIADSMASGVAGWIVSANRMVEQEQLMVRYAEILVMSLLATIGPLILLGVCVTIAVCIWHTGFVFSAHPLKPDMSKLNPAKGFKKIFSRRTWVELLKLLFKLACFVSVAYLVWKDSSAWILNRQAANNIAGILGGWQAIFTKLVVSFLVVFALFSCFDLWYSKYEFARQMRMSRRDLKDEFKQREGSPEVKSKRRKNQLELLQKVLALAKVKDADVVITNPTHVSVALRYRSRSMVLPEVVAKGRGFLAMLVRRLAVKHSVPVVGRPRLARALLADSDLRGPIPVRYQAEVADVYREIVKMPGCKVFRDD